MVRILSAHTSSERSGASARGVSHVYPGYPHSEMMGSGGSSPPAHTQRLPRSRGASLSPPLSVSEGAQLATPPRPQAAAAASVSRAMYREPVASPPRRHSAPLVAVEADESGRGVKRRRTQSVATVVRPLSPLRFAVHSLTPCVWFHAKQDRPESGQSLDVMLQAIAALETTRGAGPMQTPSPGTAPSVGFQSWPGSSGAMVVDGGMRVSPKKPPASGSDQPSKMSISRRLLLTVA